MLLGRSRWNSWQSSCSSSIRSHLSSKLSTSPKIILDLSALFAPVPPVLLLASGRDSAGHEWFQLKGRPGVYWWMVGTNHTMWISPEDSPPAQGGVQILGTPVMMIMHDKFQQLPIDREVHMQFFDRVVDIAVVQFWSILPAEIWTLFD